MNDSLTPEPEASAKDDHLRALRGEIMKGEEDIKAGRFTVLETDGDYASLAAEVRAEGMRLYKERRRA